MNEPHALLSNILPLTNSFSDDLRYSKRHTLPLMTRTIMLGLLSIIALIAYYVQSECTSYDGCQLRNTRGVSNDPLRIPRRSIFPASCLRLCALGSEFIATTYDRKSDICEVHQTGDEGAQCMVLVADPGSSVWIRKRPGRRCPNVRFMT